MLRTERPEWDHCGDGAGPDDPIGCRGRSAAPHRACLAHLTEPDLLTHLDTLGPGSRIDYRGTRVDGARLRRVLDALLDPESRERRAGMALFDEAAFPDSASFGGVGFTEEASFQGATFLSDSWFGNAVFHGSAMFGGATFTHDAGFDRAVFTGSATFSDATFVAGAGFHGAEFRGVGWFDRTVFSDTAWFRRAAFAKDCWFRAAIFAATCGFNDVRFDGDAWFRDARFFGHAGFSTAAFAADAWFDAAEFHNTAWFGMASFAHHAGFDGVVFRRTAWFDSAVFDATAHLGPLVCKGTLDISEAVFGVPITIQAAALQVRCVRTRFNSTGSLRLRYAEVELRDAVVEYPLSVTHRSVPFSPRAKPELDESPLGDADPGVRIASLYGMDAAHLVLTNVDLSRCRFVGTIHLDRLSLEGRCTFLTTRSTVRSVLPVTQRRVIAEEVRWRTERSGPTPPAATSGVMPPGPESLGPLYRQLRKSLEDGKNEPGAADFYYGEMEMRRHDRKDTPLGERALLWLYWAVSGYGLRATRALAWLGAAMTATILLLLGFGLPDTPAEPYPADAGVIGAQDPALRRPFTERFTPARAQKAADVVINSVVFRSSGQDLTTPGRYIEMTSRLTEPILLGLAALAVRGRIKRG
ncbi:pentapeptide repeat-containing protein [Streptomyces sp. NPDC051940]|uniref:pentapeptide repeat-containing protein n=1 Tax=Streptomyces sp. NPDC051940 TaxID=3155675 RepID=UPI00343703C2